MDDETPNAVEVQRPAATWLIGLLASALVGLVALLMGIMIAEIIDGRKERTDIAKRLRDVERQSHQHGHPATPSYGPR